MAEGEAIADILKYFRDHGKYEYVHFYGAVEVKLDGNFSKSELLRIASVMEPETIILEKNLIE